MEITINLSEWSWYHYAIVSSVIGLVSHLWSLPGIRRYNKKALKNGKSEISDRFVIGLFIIRITIGLPLRMVTTVLSVLCFFVSAISLGKFEFTLLKEAFYPWVISPDVWGA